MGDLENLQKAFPKTTVQPNPSRKEVFRRLSAISDVEGKSRTIAIFDYWSQTALRPVHLYLFEVLRHIPQDVTFHQDSFVDKVRQWKSIRSSGAPGDGDEPTM